MVNGKPLPAPSAEICAKMSRIRNNAKLNSRNTARKAGVGESSRPRGGGRPVNEELFVDESLRRKSIGTRDSAFRSVQHESSLMGTASRPELNQYPSRPRLPNYSIKAKHVHMLKPFFSTNGKSKQSVGNEKSEYLKVDSQEEVIYDSEVSDGGVENSITLPWTGADGTSPIKGGAVVSPRENVKTNKYHSSVMARELSDSKRISLH